ncbi:MAG: hypothetical protein E7319_06660 [Clostridiales bacterium]|nr:hypothetical protein [Clostridiales bacterium]
MKKSLPIGVCILISLVLVLFGVLYGAVSGYTDEKKQVDALLNGDNGLMDVLGYRGADGHNLCVVARRHLANDPDVEKLSQCAAILTDENQPLAAKKAENDNLDANVAAVKAKLLETPSFQENQRDQQYLSMLEGDLRNLSGTDKISLYNQAATEFNQRLEAPGIGYLARMLGVSPLEMYE